MSSEEQKLLTKQGDKENGGEYRKAELHGNKTKTNSYLDLRNIRKSFWHFSRNRKKGTFPNIS